MVVFALFGFRLQHVVDKAWFSVVLAVFSALRGVPALLRTFGFCLDFPASAAFWAVGALSSSFVYLKTGPFFVWLRRAQMCIRDRPERGAVRTRHPHVRDGHALHAGHSGRARHPQAVRCV